MRKVFIFFLILINEYLTIYSQTYSFKHLGVEDGLSNNYITYIAQDAKGCMWFGTEIGLNRFDGHNFSIYSKDNSEIPSNEIHNICYDKYRNGFWMVDPRRGIIFMDCTTQHYRVIIPNKRLNKMNISNISLARNGNIWFATNNKSILYFDIPKKSLICYNKKNIKDLDENYSFIYEAQDGLLYAPCSINNGLSIIDLKKKRAIHFNHENSMPTSLPGNRIYTIFQDHLQHIWIGTNSGLALFNQNTRQFISFHHDNNNPNTIISDHIYSIHEMKDGTLWIGTDSGGISILNLKDVEYTGFEKAAFQNIINGDKGFGLSSPHIRNVFQDSFGNIWIGNYGQGLDFISHKQPVFSILPYYDNSYKNLKYKSAWAIYIDKKQQVWIGSENELVVFKGNTLVKKYDITPYLTRKITQITAIHQDKKGCIWLGVYDDGLLKLSPDNGKISRIDLGQKYIDVLDFLEDKDGTLWIGREFGINTYKDNKLYPEYQINKVLTNTSVSSIIRDKLGRLWIGTANLGTFIFNSNKILIKHFYNRSDFISNIVYKIFVDSKGQIWIGSHNGLTMFPSCHDFNHYKRYTHEQGLEGHRVYSIEEDRYHHIWVSTDKGISRWIPQRNQFANYDYHDGAPMGDYTDATSAVAPNGDLYFGSLNGVCHFNPLLLRTGQKVEHVQIIDCSLLKSNSKNGIEKSITLSDNNEIKLSYNQNSFRITFSVPNYAQNSQIEYAYCIDETNNKWFNTNGENQITFRNLPFGKYIFKVKARVKNQSWDEKNVSSITIHIFPPIWQAWYAWMFYISLIGLFTYFVLRNYKRKLAIESSLEVERKKIQDKQELNEEKLRFYTNITHELRTPLTLILGPLEDLSKDKKLPSAYSKQIFMIYNSAIKLLHLINQLLEFRKTETQNRKLSVSKGDINNFVMETGLRFKEMNVNSKVNFKINIETPHTCLYFDADIIEMILNNLLSNAFKYTHEGEITLSLSSIDESGKKYIEIEIKDTGIGINAKFLPHIFERFYRVQNEHQTSGTGIGLHLVKSLIELHEGDIKVESIEGKGSIFRVRLLKDYNYPNALHKEQKDIEKPVIKEKDLKYENITDNIPLLMIVEDNDDIREYISTSFKMNYRVITACNGKEGWQKILSTIPDIIISDIIMPEMDGIELCKLIKQDVRTSHIPIILLTAKDTNRDKEEGYESGADSYLTKPFSANLLQSRIKNLLISRKKLAQQIAKQTKSIEPINEENSIIMNKLDEEFLKKLTDFIEQNMDSDGMNIENISDKMNMSHSTFYRKIKGLTNVSANEFIRKIRLRNSLKLLVSGSCNISEAAYKCGFNNLNHYREFFKNEYGMTPSEYLKRNNLSS